MTSAPVPENPLAFIRDCVRTGRIRWTYHASMRLRQRNLNGQALLHAIDTLEIIEAYPEDKYLPSFLLRGETREFVFHAQVATDVNGKNIRVVTMYAPNPLEWDNDERVRRIMK